MKKKAVAAGIMAAALAGCLGLVACGGGSSSKGSSDASASTSTAAPAASSTQQASTQAAKYALTIDNATTGTDYKDNPVIIVSYTFTNNSDKAVSPAGAVINKAFQNNVELSNAVVTDIDNDGYTKEIKTGGTVSYQQAYTLDGTTDVTVESSELISLSDDLLATATFSVA